VYEILVEAQSSDDVPSLVDSHPSLGTVLTWNMFFEIAELVVDVSTPGRFSLRVVVTTVFFGGLTGHDIRKTRGVRGPNVAAVRRVA